MKNQEALIKAITPLIARHRETLVLEASLLSDDAVLGDLMLRMSAYVPKAPLVAAPSVSRATTVPRKKARPGRGTSREAFPKFIARVSDFFRSNGKKAYAVSEVARALGAPKAQAARALRMLRADKRIAMAGDRRFARWSKDKKVAEAAAAKAARGATK